MMMEVQQGVVAGTTNTGPTYVGQAFVQMARKFVLPTGWYGPIPGVAVVTPEGATQVRLLLAAAVAGVAVSALVAVEALLEARPIGALPKPRTHAPQDSAEPVTVALADNESIKLEP